ncbi:MAG: MFS transporter, partial [Anaerolineae bacterium]
MTAEAPRIQRGTISFIVITAFLNLAGVGILAPVMTFIVGRYVTDPQAHTWTVSLLFMSYSLCQFIATPSLGALSDRYGRRPILLISLFGSAIGYLLLGIGGSVWMLFAGRIIDGITGGNIGTIYAYAADITTPKERTRFYGTLGAASGLGFVVGPIIGGGLYSLTGLLEAPMYAAALITLLNVVWGYFVMPESLSAERRDPQMDWARANPLTQLISVFRVPQIRLLLIAILLWTTSHSVIQSNLAHLTEDQLGWLPAQTNLLFVLIGIMQIVSQLYLIRILVPRFGEGRVALMGMVGLITGLACIGTAALTGFAPLVFGAPSFNAS